MTNDAKNQQNSSNLAKALLHHANTRVDQLADDHPERLIRARFASADARDASIEASGSVIVVCAFVYGQLTVDLTFASGERLRYLGNLGGIFIPPVVVGGVAAWFNHKPAQLVKFGLTECQTSTAGVLNVAWHKAGVPLGNAVGGGGGFALGGGTGYFIEV